MKKVRGYIKINIAICLVQGNTLMGKDGVMCAWVREMEFISCGRVI